MTVLKPGDLINLATAELVRHRTNAAAGINAPFILQKPDGTGTETITLDEAAARIQRAASIMLAESGGDTNALRPARLNPRGGDDRGLWQINNKAWPNVTDLTAYDPQASTMWAYSVSAGFTKWAPMWTGSHGLDPASAESKTIAAAYSSAEGNVKLEALGAGVLDWTSGLTALLSAITSAAFWKRVGIGAAGLALLAIGIGWIEKSDLPAALAALA